MAQTHNFTRQEMQQVEEDQVFPAAVAPAATLVAGLPCTTALPELPGKDDLRLAKRKQ